MDTMPLAFTIVVRKPTGFEESITAHCERVLIGSGAHCEVRLPVEHAAVEHVELTIVNGRVYARARAFDPAPTLGGSPLVQGFVEPGAEIGLGALRLTASLSDDLGPKKAEKAAARSGSARMIGMAAVGLVLAIVAAQAARKANDGVARAGNAPPLWSATAATCPQSAPTQALALADERRRTAEGKRERRPFHVQDGVAAVAIFQTASACYGVGGDAAQASSTAQAATELRGKVDEDYHAHQVRLEHALEVKDMPTARHEVAALRALTEGLSGPYVGWLSDLERALRPATGKGAA
jgi:hypothetical protein